MTPNPKFTHASLDWIPHIPGDPMPCPPFTLVRVLCRDGTHWLDPMTAFDLYWGDCNHKKDIIGWHHIEN